MTTGRKTLLCICVFAVFIILWSLTPVINSQFNPPTIEGTRRPDLAHVGDMFGSVNALFTGLALAAVAIQLYFQYEALKIQQTELRQNTEELRNQAEQLKEQAKALKTQAAINALAARITHYENNIRTYAAQVDQSLGRSTNGLLLSLSGVNQLTAKLTQERASLASIRSKAFNDNASDKITNLDSALALLAKVSDDHQNLEECFTHLKRLEGEMNAQP